MAAVPLPVVHELLGRVYTDAAWEALCDRCGLCCYESRWTEVGWVHTSIPCSRLDDFDRTCRVYPNRFQAEESCIRVTPSVVMSGMMPPCCAYLDEYDRLVEHEHGGRDPRQARKRARKGSRRGKGKKGRARR
jgi:uncharacterized protein